MVSEQAWSVVDQDQDALPTLVLRSSFTNDGYVIYLSDLSRIWSERLSKDALIERAQELGCSIDPGDDDAQYDIFTAKLKSALEQQPGTSLELKSTRTGSTITLSLTVKLPKPLSALEWEVHLQRDDNLMFAQLNGPLIDKTYMLQQQITYLLSEIQAKDHVLSRLMDRLESSGMPLSDVFPNVANLGGRSRVPSKEKLTQHVRGLAAFDAKDWQDRVNSQSAETHDYLAEVLGTLPTARLPKTSSKAHWWAGLDVRIERSATLSGQSASISHVESPIDGDTTVISETQFPNTAAGGQSDGSSTDDDFESNDLSSKTGVAELMDSATYGTHERTASSGGSKDRYRSTSPSQDVNSSRAQTSLARQESPLPKPRVKLGTIGGRKTVPAKPPGPAPEIDPSPEHSERPHSPAAQPKSKKLGTLGGRKKAANITPDDHVNNGSSKAIAIKQEPEQSQAQALPSKEEVPEEERADHKRDQLKRQLEQQAKAPTKKKRRF